MRLTPRCSSRRLPARADRLGSPEIRAASLLSGPRAEVPKRITASSVAAPEPAREERWSWTGLATSTHGASFGLIDSPVTGVPRSCRRLTPVDRS